VFERYNERARRVLFFARYEASQSGTKSIEPEHVLRGLLRLDDSIVARVVSQAGASTEAILAALDQQPRGQAFPTSVEIPFSAELKSAFVLAAEEANLLGHQHIGPEHLLLGLLHEGRSRASAILREQHIDLDPVRDVIRSLPPAEIHAQADQPPPLSPMSRPPRSGPPDLQARKPDLPPSYSVHISPSEAHPPGTFSSTGPEWWWVKGTELREIMSRVYGISETLIMLPPTIDPKARYEIALLLPQPEPRAVVNRLIEQAIEAQLKIVTSLESQTLDVYVVTRIASRRSQRAGGIGAVSFGMDEPPLPKVMDQFVQIMKAAAWIQSGDTASAYVRFDTELTPQFITTLTQQMDVSVAQERREVLTLVVRSRT